MQKYHELNQQGQSENQGSAAPGQNKRTRSTRGNAVNRTPQQMKAATAAQVARALGEKPPLNPQQSSVKIAAKQQEKANRDNASKTEKSHDYNALLALNVFNSVFSTNGPRQSGKAKQKLDFDDELIPKSPKLMKMPAHEDERGFDWHDQSSNTVNDSSTGILDDGASDSSHGSDEDMADGFKQSDVESAEPKPPGCTSCSRCKDLAVNGLY